MKKYDVQCPFCNGVFLETNGKYREDRPANGAMFTAKQHIIDAGWSTFPLCDSSEYANVVCPSCDQGLLDSAGKIIRKQVAGEVEDVDDAEVVRQAKAKIMEELMAEYDVELPDGGVFGGVEKILADKMTLFFDQTGQKSTTQAIPEPEQPAAKTSKPRVKKTE